MNMIDKIDEDHTKVFLFNYSTRQMYGIYAPDGAGERNLVPDAWTSTMPARDGKCRFPAQIHFKIERDCPPLPEAMFKKILLVSVRERMKGRHRFYTAMPPLQLVR